jgi:type IV pilus assembly protein PilY1
VHAFTAATGAEAWAYIPSLILGNLDLFTKKSGFTHKYYVDATPVSSDVDFNNTGGGNGSGDWRTMVVGGLGKGGRGYYALDVTSTTAASEAALTSKVLWEFPNSATSATVKANIGYTLGRPIIAKTRAQGWVVLVTSGYNNGTNAGDSGGDGKGYLFVLNAKTGALISAISTGVGSTTSPSGLSSISGYAVNGDTDNTVQYVYGGDVNGNVWRFDLTAASSNNWNVRKLAALVDAGGSAQPVTAEPELANVKVTGGAYKRFVYIGTGRLLGDTDIPGSVGANANASQTQTMYGLVDDLSDPGAGGTVITPLRTSLQQQLFTVNGDGSRTASTTAVNFSTKKGWYIDMPGSGERMDTSPALAYGALAFTSNLPSTDPCVPGGSSYLNVLDYSNGGFLNASDPTVKSSLPLGAALASRVVLIRLPSGKMVGLIQKTDGGITSVPGVQSNSTLVTKRKSWIELMQ